MLWISIKINSSEFQKGKRRNWNFSLGIWFSIKVLMTTIYTNIITCVIRIINDNQVRYIFIIFKRWIALSITFIVGSGFSFSYSINFYFQLIVCVTFATAVPYKHLPRPHVSIIYILGTFVTQRLFSLAIFLSRCLFIIHQSADPLSSLLLDHLNTKAKHLHCEQT